MNLNDGEHGPRNASSVRGGALLVSLYSWTCITLGAVITRLIIGCLHKVDFGRDDATIVVASIAYLGATISWQYAVDGGLGKHFIEVSADDADKFFKAAYAAQLLDVVAMTAGKLSFAFLVARVAPQSCRAKMALFGMVAIWGIYSTFAMAFLCGLPEPWNTVSRKCSNEEVLVSVAVLNMTTDIVLAGWILPTLRHLAMNKERRTTVAVLFGSRILVAVVAGAQIWGAIKAMPSEDPTWDGFELTLLTQAVASFSLIFASVPRIKRFIGTGGTGMLYPRITEAELAHSTIVGRDEASLVGIPLKLVPSGPNKFTTTVMSGHDKAKAQNDWQKFLSMGSKQDDHTSTSSLFDRNEHGGVNVQQEVTVKVENNDTQQASNLY